MSVQPLSRPAHGLLLVGHGTRDPQGQAEFLQLAEQIAQVHPRSPFAAGFLELAEPSIAQAVDRLCTREFAGLVVMPLLLFAAGHAKQDVPEAVRAALQVRPEMPVCQAKHLGCHPKLLDLVDLRIRSVWEAGRGGGAKPAQGGQVGLNATPGSDDLLLMVGRGSRDPEATSEMHQLAKLAAERAGFARWETCFVAMAEPRLPEMLELVAAMKPRRVLVQPHLLFQGELLKEIAHAVESVAARTPAIHFLLGERLGPHPWLAECVMDLAGWC